MTRRKARLLLNRETLRNVRGGWLNGANTGGIMGCVRTLGGGQLCDPGALSGGYGDAYDPYKQG